MITDYYAHHYLGSIYTAIHVHKWSIKKKLTEMKHRSMRLRIGTVTDTLVCMIGLVCIALQHSTDKQ